MGRMKDILIEQEDKIWREIIEAETDISYSILYNGTQWYIEWYRETDEGEPQVQYWVGSRKECERTG